MILVEEQDVLDLIGQAQRVGNTSTARNALRLATTKIENHLGTPLARVSRIDYFGCVTNVGGEGDEARALLNLSQGFVDLAQPVTVYYSTDGSPITDVNGTNVEVVDVGSYVVNAAQGRVLLSGVTPIPSGGFRTIAISYTAGFEVDDHDIAQEVPDALRHGAAALAASSMKNLSATPNKQTQWIEQMSTLRREVTGLLSAYIRPRVTGDDVQFSEIV